MARYYIDEIKKKAAEPVEEITDDKREAIWDSERAKYGFDGRDTWSLDFTMTEMLYERLIMYVEKASEIVNLEFYKYEFKGETYTQLEMIQKMINSAEQFLTFEYNAVEELNVDMDGMNGDEWDEHLELVGEYEVKAALAKQELWQMWAIVQHQMWW